METNVINFLMVETGLWDDKLYNSKKATSK